VGGGLFTIGIADSLKRTVLVAGALTAIVLTAGLFSPSLVVVVEEDQGAYPSMHTGRRRSFICDLEEGGGEASFAIDGGEEFNQRTWRYM